MRVSPAARWAPCLLAGAWAAGPTAWADPPPAEPAAAAVPAGGAIVLTLEGDAQCECGARRRAPVAAFDKLRPGDVVVLGDGVRAELVFFTTGRREGWMGPARVSVGPAGGSATGAAPTVTDVGVEVGRTMEALPTIARRAALGGNAGTVVRGVGEPAGALVAEEVAAVEAARARYASLRAVSPDSDVLPELYLGAMYVDLGQYAESAAALEEARARCASACGPIDQLLSWVRANERR